MKRVLIFLLLGPVMAALICAYAFRLNLPFHVLLIAGLAPSLSALWKDWQQGRAGFPIGQRLFSCLMTGAFGGIIGAAIPRLFDQTFELNAYSMMAAGGAGGILCCLLAARTSARSSWRFSPH